MRNIISTRSFSPGNEYNDWKNAIDSTYFPLTLQALDQQSFEGELQAWDAPQQTISLSRLSTSAMCFSRDKSQINRDSEASYLVTLPQKSEVVFAQNGRELRCPPGMFILEKSEEPYRFHYHADNSLFVLKIPERELKGNLYEVDRYFKYCFDATQGLGRIFAEQLNLFSSQFDACTRETRHLLLSQAIATLTLALRNDQRVLSSEDSNLAALHLHRVDSYIEKHLTDPDLSPRQIADACKISLRYLHKLFLHQPMSPCQLIRHKRLEAAHKDLTDPNCHLSIGELAFRWGFSDQAQFSRAFRQHFACTASEVRAKTS